MSPSKILSRLISRSVMTHSDMGPVSRRDVAEGIGDRFIITLPTLLLKTHECTVAMPEHLRIVKSAAILA
jgi:hypothetical protein